MIKNIFVILLMAIVFVSIGCDNKGTSNNSNDPQPGPEPVPGIATDIKLSVYSNGWGTLLDTFTVNSESEVVIDIDEIDPYYDPPQYYIYAEANNYYTELYNCLKGETITVDLDSVESLSKSITGVIFGRQVYFADCYYSDATLLLNGPYNIHYTITTDNQGRYAVGGLLTGDYTIEFSQDGQDIVLNLFNSSGTDYEDLSFFEVAQAYAPNIYLYPETTITANVSLSFPNGGHVTESSPPYGNGWTVTVSPEGIIDNEYDYLFYEASLPSNLSMDYGWLLTTDNLENEFRVLLANLGFIGREIDDFVDYWVPILDDAPYYGFYPQDINSLIELTINPAPVNTLRELFLVRALYNEIDIPAPPDNGLFNRDGYVAVEWGVIAFGLGDIDH